MMLGIEQFELLLVIAALVAVVARRLHAPYAVGLVLAGIALGFVPAGRSLHVGKELVFGALLPPLVFEAALNIRWADLRRDLAFVGTLATVGVGVSAAIVAAGAIYLLGWDPRPAWVFGALISATDPVSVIALFKEHGGGGRLRLLVEADSLLNDGTAAVAFGLAVAVAGGSTAPSVGEAAGRLALVIVGSLAVGAGVAAVAMAFVHNVADHLVELVLTTAAAYGSFQLAEHFGFSGILAALTAGLAFGNVGRLAVFTEKGRDSLEPFWEFGAFAATSIVFLLMGVKAAQVPYAAFWRESAIAIGFVLLARAITVYGICLPFRWSKSPVQAIQQHVLFWGGLRGALALALVLSLPEHFPAKGRLTAVVFAVVAFSVLVQGLTVGPLIRRGAAAKG